MDRRTFVVGTGIGLGLAGCLDANTDGSDGSNRTGEGEQYVDDDGSSPNQRPKNATDAGNRSETKRTDSGTESEGDVEKGEETGAKEEDAGEAEDDASGEGDGSDRDVTFRSCTRATVTGTFEDGDVAFASTGFYDDGLFGNTAIEDGITFGEDVDAPFSGTVAFEIGAESAVRAGGEEIVVEIPSYGSDGTVITGLTTDQTDYLAASTTHENPNASECLREIEQGSESNATDGEDGATFEIARLETNTPLDAGEFLEVSATVENTGGTDGTQNLELIVGHSAERVERRSVTLGAGERTDLTTGYETPRVDTDQEFPIRLETDDDAVERSVLVYGTG